MAASANDKMRKVKGFFSTTLSSQKNSGAASMSLSDATGVPTTTGLIFTVGRVNSQGVSTPSTRAIYKGTLSGTTVSNLSLVEGTDQTHAAGTVVEMTWTETHVNDLIDALTAEHSQLDGTHTNITATGLTISSVTWASLITGWQQAGETWTYSAWDSTNKTGTITVPSDATTKYTAGMRIRISQSTGGTKYFIITKVATTELSVYGGTDYTLNNETISSPFYSVHKAPYGFPLNPAKWTVTASSSSDRSISGTSYGSLTDTISVPIGLWRLHMRATFGKGTAASTTNDLYHISLSSDGSTETNTNLTAFANFRFGASGASSSGAITSTTEDFVSVTSATTFTLIGKKNSGADNGLVGGSIFHPTVFRAICAYL